MQNMKRITEDGFERLAAAIIAQAARDYSLDAGPHASPAQKKVKADAERFLRGEWCEALGMDGTYIIKKIDEMKRSGESFRIGDDREARIVTEERTTRQKRDRRSRAA